MDLTKDQHEAIVCKKCHLKEVNPPLTLDSKNHLVLHGLCFNEETTYTPVRILFNHEKPQNNLGNQAVVQNQENNLKKRIQEVLKEQSDPELLECKSKFFPMEIIRKKTKMMRRTISS